MTTEYVPDPGFDDAGAWLVSNNSAGEVTGSQLVMTDGSLGPEYANAIPSVVLVSGLTYAYSFNVETLDYPYPYDATINIAGVEIYIGDNGLGVFSDSFVALTTDELQFNWQFVEAAAL